MGYICTRCGGTNVVCEAIVNPNTGKIITTGMGVSSSSCFITIKNEKIWKIQLLFRLI